MTGLRMFLLGAAAGLLAGSIGTAMVMWPNPWANIDRFREISANHKDYLRTESPGMSYISGDDLPSIEESLGRLVDQGAARRSTFFIANGRTRENHKTWMSSPHVLYGDGLPEQKSGDNLIITLWYKSSDMSMITQMIEAMRATVENGQESDAAESTTDTVSSILGDDQPVSQRWDWLVAHQIVTDHGQGAEYQRGFTHAVRQSLDKVLTGVDLYWSPLVDIVDISPEEQQGYFDGMAAASQAIETHIALALGLPPERIEYLARGKYQILPQEAAE